MRLSLSYKLVLLVSLLFGTVGICFAADILRLSTTTSTENSGLIEKLVPVFEAKHDVSVHTIVGGTGRALNHARNGDVDIILVHAKYSELELVESGFGVNRQEIMYNEFIIVGPESDLARINGMKNIQEALANIANTRSAFVSRGDDSGTHKKELRLWNQAGIKPEGDWYKEVGLGMGKALQIADELNAYVLADKGTWLFMRDRLSLPIHVEGALDGRNVYGAIAVNPEVHPHVNYEDAMNLINWLKSDEAKNIISTYRVNGEQLFYVIE